MGPLQESPHVVRHSAAGVVTRLMDISDLVAMLIEAQKKAAQDARLRPPVDLPDGEQRGGDYRRLSHTLPTRQRTAACQAE